MSSKVVRALAVALRSLSPAPKRTSGTGDGAKMGPGQEGVGAIVCYLLVAALPCQLPRTRVGTEVDFLLPVCHQSVPEPVEEGDESVEDREKGWRRRRNESLLAVRAATYLWWEPTRSLLRRSSLRPPTCWVGRLVSLRRRQMARRRLDGRVEWPPSGRRSSSQPLSSPVGVQQVRSSNPAMTKSTRGAWLKLLHGEPC